MRGDDPNLCVILCCVVPFIERQVVCYEINLITVTVCSINQAASLRSVGNAAYGSVWVPRNKETGLTKSGAESRYEEQQAADHHLLARVLCGMTHITYTDGSHVATISPNRGSKGLNRGDNCRVVPPRSMRRCRAGQGQGNKPWLHFGGWDCILVVGIKGHCH